MPDGAEGALGRPESDIGPVAAVSCISAALSAAASLARVTIADVCSRGGAP